MKEQLKWVEEENARLIEGKAEKMVQLEVQKEKEKEVQVPSLGVTEIEKEYSGVEQHKNEELKSLPLHLKYAFLGENEIWPVIIFLSLNEEEKSKLVSLLKECKVTIGWSMANIKEISPTV